MAHIQVKQRQRPGCPKCRTRAHKPCLEVLELRWVDASGRSHQETHWDPETAEIRLHEVEADAIKGKQESGAHRYSKRKLSEVYADRREIQAATMRPTALRTYDQIWRQYIAPEFGHRALGSITSDQIERWVARLRRPDGEQLSLSRRRNVYFALSGLLRYAVKHRWIEESPTTHLGLTGKGGLLHVDTEESSERLDRERVLSRAEVEALASELPWPYGLMVRFTAQTGLRSAEVAGLRMQDLKLDRREVRVRQTARWEKGDAQTGRAKSKKSKREIPLQPSMVSELREYLVAHPRSGNRDAPLWPGMNRGGGAERVPDWTRPLHMESFYSWHFLRAQVRAGVRGEIEEQPDGTWVCRLFEVEDGEREQLDSKACVTREEAVRYVAANSRDGHRFHDLRHTAASNWIDAGVSIYKVSRWLGHATTKITETVYADFIPDDDSAEEMAAMDSFWTNQETSAGPSGSAAS